MNRLLLLSIFFIASLKGFSQTDSSGSRKAASYDTIIEKLVRLALNNPKIKFAEYSANQISYEYSRSKSAWLNNITLAGNLNEISLKRTLNSDPILQQATNYPRYNVGVVLPIGIFVNNKKQSKAIYESYQAAVEQVSITKDMVRQQVATGYEDYLMYQTLITLQNESVQDARILYNKAVDKFQKGELSLDEFSKVSKGYNAEKVREIELQHELNRVLINMESLINMKLLDALSQISAEMR
ncbi:MAG: hypothetical protein DI535_08760 [Citrobacter freundii]|nr:MAG: hypothetical protein DI535_08760 [Citrobacter freundii]